MQSGYKICWTPAARENLNGIIKYLEENWSGKEIKSFTKKLDKRLKLISLNPKLFPKTDRKKNVRKSVLTKHTVIYYLFDDVSVMILALFDPREHPSKLKL